MEDIKKNDEFIVDIIDYGADGEGIAKINGYTIFVIGALKGEKCKIHILKVLKTHAFAKIAEIITKMRDLRLLENAYKIESITPVDNFCYSSHVECVCVMSLR